MPTLTSLHALVGIGLRPAHMHDLSALQPDLGFLEVHSENHFAEGGASRQILHDWRARYPISLHGVGLSLGSACGLDETHLNRLVQLARDIDPIRISDHASFARVSGEGRSTVHGADLLPLPLTPTSVDILQRNIGRAQDALQRSILVENLSAYMAYEDDSLSEVDFLIAVCQRTGCQLLLDLNNLIVNGLNRYRRRCWRTGEPFDISAAQMQARADALNWVWSLPPGLVGQIHLAGFRWPERDDRLFIDDHSQRVSPMAWDVYEQTLIHLGPLPTLIEWDTDLPPVAVLLDEARLAAHTLAKVTGQAQTSDDEDEGG
jgi:uncharacterized protein (UPF0276 family)